jgi:hypothetical protein
VINNNKLGRNAQVIATAEQQLAHGCVSVIIIIAKREGDARGRAAAPVVLALWLWNGIKMRIARLKRVLRNKRGAAIGGGRRRFPPCFIGIEDWDHDHSDVKSARGVVANLNVGRLAWKSDMWPSHSREELFFYPVQDTCREQET